MVFWVKFWTKHPSTSVVDGFSPAQLQNKKTVTIGSSSLSSSGWRSEHVSIFHTTLYITGWNQYVTSMLSWFEYSTHPSFSKLFRHLRHDLNKVTGNLVLRQTPPSVALEWPRMQRCSKPHKVITCFLVNPWCLLRNPSEFRIRSHKIIHPLGCRWCRLDVNVLSKMLRMSRMSTKT